MESQLWHASAWEGLLGQESGGARETREGDWEEDEAEWALLLAEVEDKEAGRAVRALQLGR